MRGFALNLIALASLAACAPRETAEQARARAIMAAVQARHPAAAFGKVWANGSWTCGRFTDAGAEKGFLGQTPGAVWVEGPDSAPYYERAWVKFCTAPKPPLF